MPYNEEGFYMSCEDRNYSRDRRVTATFIEPPSHGKFHWEICDICEGHGKHVNPSIDASGLTSEDFDEDPDFAESYRDGMYDISCTQCAGSGKVPVDDDPKATKLDKCECGGTFVDEEIDDGVKLWYCEQCGMERGAKEDGPFTVAIFMIDRAYGGPEEGGWYYDCGTPVTEPELVARQREFPTREEARSYRQMIADTVLPELNNGRRSINSVLSEGQYDVQVCHGEPVPYPATRPHYE